MCIVCVWNLNIFLNISTVQLSISQVLLAFLTLMNFSVNEKLSTDGKSIAKAPFKLKADGEKIKGVVESSAKQAKRKNLSD